MKTNLLLLLALGSSSIALLAQARAPKSSVAPPPPPPVVVTAPAAQSSPAQPATPPIAPAPAPATPGFIYEQKPLPGRPYLVTPEQAQTVINRFKEIYPQLQNPRILIYVNRELVDEEAGLKLSARSEQTEIVKADVRREFQPDEKAAKSTNATQISGTVVLGDLNANMLDALAGKGSVTGQIERANNKNTYRVREKKQAPLADKQTVRDIERLFGRPLRMAGATVVDQRLAAQMIPDAALKNLTVQTEGQQAQKDREAISKIADIVLEVLISSRQITVPELSGSKNYLVPDIQATAIRLSDSKILGQVTSADLLGDERNAGRIARTFSVREVTEATALALMEDIMP